MNKYKIWLRKHTLLTAGAFVFILILLEAGLRLSETVDREGYGLGNIGTSHWFTFQTNSYGFREEEIQLDKGPDEFRILFIGDSFTFGQGVAREDSFPRILEQRWLKDNLGLGRTIRVINASKLGWNIQEEAAFLNEEAFHFNPDVIILVTIPNDNDVGITEEPFYNQRITNSILWNSHLVRLLFIRWLWISFEYIHPEQNIISHIRGLWAEDSSSLKLYERHFRSMVSSAKLEGVDFLQVLFPLFYKLEPNGYPIYIYHEQAMRMAEETDVPCMDLLPSYLGYRSRALIISETDFHPNETAHAIAADSIDPFVRSFLSANSSSAAR